MSQAIESEKNQEGWDHTCTGKIDGKGRSDH